MLSVRFKRILVLASFYIVVLVSVWALVCHLKLVDPLLLPPPMEVLGTALKMLRAGELQYQALVSLKRMLGGFLLGGICGLAVGSICGVSKKINHWVEPLLYLAYPIPRFALLPFVMLIFGVGGLSKVMFVAMASFFPVTINTISGINNINDNYLEVARHYGASGWKLYKRVVWPGSLPSIFSALRISISLTVSSTTVIEFLTSTNGLGAMIWLSLQALRTDKLFLGTIVISSLNMMFIFTLKTIQNFSTPWAREKALAGD